MRPRVERCRSCGWPAAPHFDADVVRGALNGAVAAAACPRCRQHKPSDLTTAQVRDCQAAFARARAAVAS
jgi:hypothetical protein